MTPGAGSEVTWYCCEHCPDDCYYFEDGHPSPCTHCDGQS
jgi:hypothetical protein